MAVVTEEKLVRNSYLTLYMHTSGDAGSTGIADTSTQAEVLRYVGGSTVASSSEATVKLDVCDRIGFLVGWCCTALSTGTRYIKVEAGDNWHSVYGDLNISLTPSATGSTAAAVTKMILGPFESARFGMQATSTDPGVGIGENYVKFSVISDASSNSQAQYVNILPFRWPDTQYDT
jgi:hypothetical protein